MNRNDLERCYYRRRGEWTRLFAACDGYPDASRDRWASQPAAVAQWLADRKFAEYSEAHRVPIGTTGMDSTAFWIARVHDTDRIALKELGARGLLMARILADPTRPQDRLYGIGKQPDLPDVRLRSVFYLAIDPYDSDGATTAQGTAVSTWHVYGIDARPQRDTVVKLRRTGTFRLCHEEHKGEITEHGAAFLSCALADGLMRIQERPEIKARLQGRYLYDELLRYQLTRTTVGALDREQLARSSTVLASVVGLLDENEFGVLDRVVNRRGGELFAWMKCGLGCCAAESEIR